MNVFGPIPSIEYQNGYDQFLSRQKNQNSLKEQELRNKYYGPNIESEMANRNALTQGYNINNQYAPERLGLANKQAQQNLEWNPRNWQAQNNLRGAQTNEINTLLQSKLDSAKTQAAQNKIINDALSGVFQNKNLGITTNPNNQQINQNNPNNNMQGNYSPSSSNMMQNFDNNINNIPKGQGGSPQMTNGNGMTYPKAAILNHLLGLGQAQIHDVNGKKMAITPWGNFTVAEGLSPKQESYEKGIGKYNSDAYGKHVEAANALQNQDVALDNMISELDNPEFYNTTGPVSSFLTNWAGTPEKQQLLGSLRTSSGEIALQVAPSLKGAFTGRDQSLLNTIKANPDTDMPDVFIGKLKAQKMIGSLLGERHKLAAEYIDNGMSALKANEKAAQQTPLSKYKHEIDKLISPKISLKNPNTGESKRFTKDEISKLIKEKKLKLTPEQAKKLGVKV